MTSVADDHDGLPLRPALALVVLLLGLAACSSDPQSVRLQGQVFGTGWSLVYQVDEGIPTPEVVEAEVLAAFAVVNESMNTYDPQSAISRFNALPAGEAMEMDWDFTYVFNEARRLTEITGGAYDVTVSPLIDLWGFGPAGATEMPSDARIAAVREHVGMDQLVWQPGIRTLEKRHAQVAVELSSIAKGYGVDLAADALDALGVLNFMLEVGGELQLRGNSPRGDAWRIAVERPDFGQGNIQATIGVSNTGVATSGDYRNFFEENGQRYSHLIDPRTGYPIAHDVVSVTVIHPSTALADAWATALCVLGSAAALEIAEQQALAVYLVRREAGVLEAAWSNGFQSYLVSSDASG